MNTKCDLLAALMNVFFQAFLLIPLCSFLLGCTPLSSPDSSLPFIEMPNGQQLMLEIVSTPKDQAAGLMNRIFLPEDQGMLFVFERERALSFWMKNTLIPLDVLYLDADGVVVDLQTMAPCPEEELRCPSYPSAHPAQYAIEINAGTSESFAVSVGDTLLLPVLIAD